MLHNRCMNVQQNQLSGLETIATRKSIPLSPRDLRDLAVLRGSSARRSALAQLAHTDVRENASEAQLLHAILEAGLRAIELRIEEESYAADAESQRSEDAERRAAARRRAPHWVNES